MLEDNLSVEELTECWLDANDNGGCSCHNHPPCEYCVDGYSLELEEFLSVYGYDPEPPETPADAYDRAMKSVI